MDAPALRRHTTARLLAGRAVPLVGFLLAAHTRRGELVAIDPETAGEAADDRPAFVLSTEAEASDGNVVRQHWNLTRASAGGPGAPVLWNHNQDVLLGQWQELGVRQLEAGPALVGRALLDPDDELAQKRRSQIRRGMLNAVSVGWIPGARVRRGSLKEEDPLFRPLEDDACGDPAEGLVMGTEAEPNILVEASLVPCPAQQTAVVIERLHRGGAEDLARAVGAPPGGDPDRLLAYLAAHPRVRSFLTAELTRIVRAELERSPHVERTLGDIFRHEV